MVHDVCMDTGCMVQELGTSRVLHSSLSNQPLNLPHFGHSIRKMKTPQAGVGAEGRI